jgi:hypothetical protein
MTKEKRAEVSEWHTVPLYRHPQPTLTDAEREAIEWYAAYGTGDHSATLRSLLARLSLASEIRNEDFYVRQYAKAVRLLASKRSPFPT